MAQSLAAMSSNDPQAGDSTTMLSQTTTLGHDHTPSYIDLDEGTLSHIETLVNATLERTNADHASLRVCDPYPLLKAVVRTGVASEGSAPRFCVGEGVVGWVAYAGKPAFVPDVRLDRRFIPKTRDGYEIGSLHCTPIRGAGKVIGVLSIASSEVNGLNEWDARFADLMAECIEQALRTRDLERQALTDAHTGAYNRRYLDQRLSDELEQAKTTKAPLTLMVLDLDHFKRVNDTLGHHAGDELLKEFVERVRETVRNTDVIIRDGGEEFILVMPQTDEAAAHHIGERIRCAIGERPFLRNRVRQTVSVGIATWDELEESYRLRQRADFAMYRAKARGRNRICTSDGVRRMVRSQNRRSR